jgi:hypothetical protein
VSLLERLSRPIANRFRVAVSGSPDGLPEWAKRMAEGDDEGLFGPESAVWTVHGSVSTLVGGIRALLLQAAHPGVLAGVSEHSRYDVDPLGRLAGTTRWLVTTTFGATSVVLRDAARVNGMHRSVNGTYETRGGATAPYAARDPKLLLWVQRARVLPHSRERGDRDDGRARSRAVGFAGARSNLDAHGTRGAERLVGHARPPLAERTPGS